MRAGAARAKTGKAASVPLVRRWKLDDDLELLKAAVVKVE
jgi:hypothetical protein